MPIPIAAVGIAALGAVITKVIEKTVDFIFSKTMKHLLIFGVVVAGYAAAIATLMSYGSSLASDLISAMPPEISSIGVLLPSNTSTCLGVVIATEMACITYVLTVRAFRIKLEAVR